MNRTAICRVAAAAALLAAAVGFAAPLVAQDPEVKPQPTVPATVVAAMRAAEAAAAAVDLAMETSGRMAGGLTFVARGSVRVLRAEQSAPARTHTVVDYEFGDGLTGRVETVQTEEGILTLQQDPTFGETFVRIDAATCKDLEWAAAASPDDEVPFQSGPRAGSPLGADLFADLSVRFDLRSVDKALPEGMQGTWWAGDRKQMPGGDAEAADLPVADRVEAFVRDDWVLMDVQYVSKGEVVQRVRLQKAVLGGEIPKDGFRINAGGKQPVAAKDHPPTWQQIEQALQRASEKKGGELPPSRR